MKKVFLFFRIFLVHIPQIALSQVYNERTYSPNEINRSKNELVNCFINNRNDVILDSNGTFIYSSFDNGNGNQVNYSNNESYVKTIIASDTNDKVAIRLVYFLTEANNDFLYIYDGLTENSPLLAKLSGHITNIHNYYKSSSNALTLKFVSNVSDTDIGFKLNVFSEKKNLFNPMIQKKLLDYNNSVPASDECINAPLIVNFSNYVGTTSGSYTSDTTGLANFCGTIENNSWLSFIANSTDFRFVFKSANCQSSSSGIQVGIYETSDCLTFNEISDCQGQLQGPGTFTVTNNVPLQIGEIYYIMIDGFGNNVCSYTITADPGTIGNVEINSTYMEICPGYTTTLSSSMHSNNYIWIDSFGNTYANQKNITVSPNVTTTYSLTIDSNATGITNVSKTITVNSTLSTPTIISPAIVCANQTVTLTVSNQGYNYIWLGPNNFLSFLKNPTITNFNMSNNGTYSLTIDIDSNCKSNVGIKNIGITSSPTVSVLSSQTAFCNFNSTTTVTLSASSSSSSSNGYIWSWNTDEADVVGKSCISNIFGTMCGPSYPLLPGMSAGGNATITPYVATSLCVRAIDINGCQSSDTCIMITETSTSVLQVSSGSISICRGDSALINVNGTPPFTWITPVIGGVVSLSSDGDSLLVTPNTTTTYTVKTFDTNLCSKTKLVTVYIDSVCVWSGDTDYDGIVNQNDLLPIGIYYGLTGTPRPNASTNWEGQYSLPWGQIQANGISLKHIDCNGDGMITAIDTSAIYQNISLTHPLLKTINTNTLNPEASITFNKTFYSPGDTVIASLNLGTDTTQLTNFYGSAFKLIFDNLMVKPNTLQFNFINSWVGDPSQNMLTFQYLNTPVNEFLLAHVRKTHSNVSGYGKIAELKLVLRDTLTSTLFSISLADGIKVSNIQNRSLLSNLTSTVPINTNIVTSILQTKDIEFSIAPNPTSGLLNISSQYNMQKIEVTSVTGQLLFSELTIEKTYQLQLNKLSDGVYFIKVIHANGLVVTKKIILNS